MSKLKEPLFYALHNRWTHYRVVAVTTYKEGTGRWHGRYVRDNEGTHGRGDIHGRFATEAEAQAKIDGLEEIRKRHKAPIARALREYNIAQGEERDEIANYLKDGK